MKTCAVCAGECEQMAHTCPNCGEASFEAQPQQDKATAEGSSSVDSAQRAPSNNEPRRDARRGR